MNFLPQGYQTPKTSGYYMKLQDGENKIRILSQPILGWEDWKDNKPVRFRFNEKPLKSFDPKKPIKHFWAFIVWNYNEEQIQILQITQATLKKGIEALCNDADWGAPYFYDIKIIKKGEMKETEYMVNPLPHKPVSKEVIKEFNNRKCNLDALFVGEDPFSSEWNVYTIGIFDHPENGNTKNGAKIAQIGDEKGNHISKKEAEELGEILNGCEPKYLQQVWKTLKNSNIESLEQIPLDIYPRLKAAAIKNREQFQGLEKESEMVGSI